MTPAPLNLEPLVSVLMANYNYGSYVGAALDSMLAQTYRNFEVIVCDDGSADDSCAIIEGYVQRDDRITLLRKENGGAASALNAAHKKARGEVVCLLDADDTFEVTKLERLVATFGSHDWGIVVHPLTVVDQDGVPIQRKPALSHFEEGFIRDDVLRRGGRWSYMEASAVNLRKQVGDIIFPIPEKRFRSWADAYLCVMAALVAPVGYIDEALASYRIHGTNVSGFNTIGEGHGAKAMEGWDRLITGVNERLAQTLSAPPKLDKRDNLAYLESELMWLIFRRESTRRAQLSAYLHYSRLVLADHIYSPMRKVLSIFFLGAALALPRSKRPAWITAGLTHSRFKERVRNMTRWLSPRRVAPQKVQP